MKIIQILAVLGFGAVLAACGAGGGNAGTPVGTTGTTTSTGSMTGTAVVTPASSSVSDFIFQLDKTSINNSGTDKSTLIVTTLDASKNVVGGASVSVALDTDGVFTPTAGSTTDATGKYSGVVTTGGVKTNRVINATVTVNGKSKVASINVTGSQLTLVAVPATPTPGQLVTVNLSAQDSALNAIQAALLTLAGTAGATGTVTTDSAGNAVISFLAPSAQGSYTVIATGAGVSVTKVIQVATAGSSSIPAAVGAVSSASLSSLPTQVSPNAIGATTNRAKLIAKFLTTGNITIPNMRVRFEIVPPALGSGEAISTGDATVYSDASGVATADYIAGTRSSPTNGVTVRVCYKSTDFTSIADCPNSVYANLTVAGTPLGISISDNNKLGVGLGGIGYIKQFLIQVNDAAGNASVGAVVSASVDITHYGKGLFTGTPSYQITGGIPPSIINTYTNTFSTTATTAAGRIWCLNEDANRNGFLDSGEDLNVNGKLEPSKAEIVLAYVNGNVTDNNGQLLVQAFYGQNVGTWLAYTVRATTSVAGSEGLTEKSYITDILAADVANGSFLTPPYGTGRCIDPN
jgi:hypothetical protein